MDWMEDFDFGLLDREALEFLIEYDLDDPAKGITAQVISKGLDSLSEKQLYVFKRDVVDKWLVCTCRGCPHTAEGYELIGFWENDGYCGDCVDGYPG